MVGKHTGFTYHRTPSAVTMFALMLPRVALMLALILRGVVQCQVCKLPEQTKQKDSLRIAKDS